MTAKTEKNAPARTALSTENDEMPRFNTSFEQRLWRLRRPVPPELVKHRELSVDGGPARTVPFIEWHAAADLLDEKTPGWSHRVKSIHQVGETVVVTAVLTIDGVSREGLGTGPAGAEFGIKRAEHDALNRAAVKFGLGRDLYKAESDLIDSSSAGAASTVEAYDPANPPSDPVATGLRDGVTAGQMNSIRELARGLDLDPDDECRKIWPGVRTNELNRKAADFLFGHLDDLRAEKATGKAGAETETAAGGEPEAPETAPELEAPETAPEAVQVSPAVEAPAAPEKSELPAEASIADASTAHFTPAQMQLAEQWREEIRLGLKSVGIRSEGWLAKFDTSCDTLLKKKFARDESVKAVVSRKREQIQTALAEQKWSIEEIDREFALYGIAGGFASVSAGQIEKMWDAYRTARMI